MSSEGDTAPTSSYDHYGLEESKTNYETNETNYRIIGPRLRLMNTGKNLLNSSRIIAFALFPVSLF